MTAAGLLAALVPSTDARRLTCLHLASTPRAITILFMLGADLEAVDPHGCTPLLNHSLSFTGRLAVISALLRCGAKADCYEKDLYSALIVSSMAGHANIAQLLLQFGADIGHVDSNGQDALITAARLGERETVQVLLAWGADVAWKDNDGRTALELATAGGYEAIAKLLRHPPEF